MSAADMVRAQQVKRLNRLATGPANDGGGPDLETAAAAGMDAPPPPPMESLEPEPQQGGPTWTTDDWARIEAREEDRKQRWHNQTQQVLKIRENSDDYDEYDEYDEAMGYHGDGDEIPTPSFSNPFMEAASAQIDRRCTRSSTSFSMDEAEQEREWDPNHYDFQPTGYEDTGMGHFTEGGKLRYPGRADPTAFYRSSGNSPGSPGGEKRGSSLNDRDHQTLNF